MNLTQSALNIMLLSFSLTSAMNATSQTVCIESVIEVPLTEEMIVSVMKDTELSEYFDPTAITTVEIKRHTCTRDSVELNTTPPMPDFPQEGDTRELKQQRTGGDQTGPGHIGGLVGYDQALSDQNKK